MARTLGSTEWANRLGLPLGVFAAPLLGALLVQYLRYGTVLYLGWDTSTYAWWANLVNLHGSVEMMLRWNYPNLYPVLLAPLGQVLGGVEATVKVVPVLAALPFGYACYWLTGEITANHKLGLLAAFIAGFSINTLRLESDLHRNLLAFSIAFLLGALISARVMLPGSTPRNLRTQAVLVWLPLLAVVAYTHIETYVVLSLTLVIVLGFFASRRVFIGGLLLVATPIALAIPLLYRFFIAYASEALKSIPQPLVSSLVDTLLFLGAFALPLTALGLFEIVDTLRRGHWAARYVVCWIVSLLIVIPPAVVLGLPSTRGLFMFPVPVVLGLGVVRLSRLVKARAAARTWTRGSPAHRSAGNPHPTSSSTSETVSGVALLLVVTLALATTVSTADFFLRPYVAEQDVLRLREAAALAGEAGFAEPIVVYFGSKASGFAPIYRAYYGAEIPDSLAYYGKLQFVFTLPDASVFSWGYNPAAEAVNAANYRAEIISRLGSPSAVATRAIVIAGGGTYDHPLSETFISGFERQPGIFVIPPNSLTPQEIDSWRLFAYVDATVSVPARSVPANWSIAPKVLEWTTAEPQSPFEASLLVSLATAWNSMRLTLRVWDWQPTLPVGPNATVPIAPLEVYVDGSRVLVHQYGGLGPLVLALDLANVGPGLHQIALRTFAPGMAEAVRLDSIELVPTG